MISECPCTRKFFRRFLKNRLFNVNTQYSISGLLNRWIDVNFTNHWTLIAEIILSHYICKYVIALTFTFTFQISGCNVNDVKNGGISETILIQISYRTTGSAISIQVNHL